MNEAIPATEQTPPTRSKLRRGLRYALIGLVFGFLGLGIAAYRMSEQSEPPPRPKAKGISEVLTDTIKKTADKLLHKKPAPSPTPPPAPEVVAWPHSKQLGLAAFVCGFIGAFFGCISWLVGEHRRWTWAALCVGIAALAWTHVVGAVAVAIAIVIAIWLFWMLLLST